MHYKKKPESLGMCVRETRETMPLRAAAAAALVENWMKKTDSLLYFFTWASWTGCHRHYFINEWHKHVWNRTVCEEKVIEYNVMKKSTHDRQSVGRTQSYLTIEFIYISHKHTHSLFSLFPFPSRIFIAFYL